MKNKQSLKLWCEHHRGTQVRTRMYYNFILGPTFWNNVPQSKKETVCNCLCLWRRLVIGGVTQRPVTEQRGVWILPPAEMNMLFNMCQDDWWLGELKEAKEYTAGGWDNAWLECSSSRLHYSARTCWHFTRLLTSDLFKINSPLIRKVGCHQKTENRPSRVFHLVT